MLGRFLEISVHSQDVLGSLTFYERLGFTQIPGNDAWSHPYGIVTDGRCFIGLHAYAFPGPSLTFVAPELRRRIDQLEAAGARFEFLKLADDEFHELGFYAPDEQMVTLLEARTFSPPAIQPGESALGYFAEYRIPVDDERTALEQWLRLGMIENDAADSLHDGVSACCTGLGIGLTESRRLKKPALVFHVDDLEARIEQLGQRETLAIKRLEARAPGIPRAAEIAAPEGTSLLLVEAG